MIQPMTTAQAEDLLKILKSIDWTLTLVLFVLSLIAGMKIIRLFSRRG